MGEVQGLAQRPLLVRHRGFGDTQHAGGSGPGNADERGLYCERIAFSRWWNLSRDAA